MRIIELTKLPNSDKACVNANAIIRYVRFEGKNSTWVEFGYTDSEMRVKETPEQITELIKNAPEL